MKPELRRERIVELVNDRGRITVDELAMLLGGSRETVRRDLAVLGGAGRIRKVHGGATMPGRTREDAFADRLMEAVREKRAIAASAVRLFEPGDTLFIDVGTTTLVFAQALAGRPGITVVTNGLEIAKVIGARDGKVFVIGGEYDAEIGEMTGPFAVEQVERFHASHAVITVGGLTVNGAMDFQPEEAQVARAMVRQARRVTVLADASKFGRDALFKVCPLERIDRLVTNSPPSATFADVLHAAGVQIILADGQ